MIYRILTEDKNRKLVQDEVSRHFSGYTVYTGIGVWQGGTEKNLTIEIDTLGDDNRLAVYRIAEYIKKVNGQEAVLIQEIESKSKLI